VSEPVFQIARDEENRRTGGTAVYEAAARGELDHVAPGYFMKPFELPDHLAALIAIRDRNSSATMCLASALVFHGLSDQIPTATEIALPRGQRPLVSKLGVQHWHSFDKKTFELGRELQVLDFGVEFAVYSAERTIVDLFRLSGPKTQIVAVEALKAWIAQQGVSNLSNILQVASKFPSANKRVTEALRILLA
jgi:predicted transcriptional regulator of viral defense system